MKLSEAFGLFTDLRIAIQIAFWPTLVNIWHSPLLLLQPHKLSQVFMAHVWLVFGKGVDENGKSVKEALITPHATGVILDLGAGSAMSPFTILSLRLRTVEIGRTWPDRQISGSYKSHEIYRSRTEYSHA